MSEKKFVRKKDYPPKEYAALKFIPDEEIFENCTMSYKKTFLHVMGLVCSVCSYFYMLALFVYAYLQPTKTALVTINVLNELPYDIIAFIIATPAVIYFSYKHFQQLSKRF